MAHEIVISMEGGLIQEIDGIPPGLVIRVRDFDVEGADDSELSRDSDGDPYYETVWPRENACQAPDGQRTVRYGPHALYNRALSIKSAS